MEREHKIRDDEAAFISLLGEDPHSWITGHFTWHLRRALAGELADEVDKVVGQVVAAREAAWGQHADHSLRFQAKDEYERIRVESYKKFNSRAPGFWPLRIVRQLWKPSYVNHLVALCAAEYKTPPDVLHLWRLATDTGYDAKSRAGAEDIVRVYYDELKIDIEEWL